MVLLKNADYVSWFVSEFSRIYSNLVIFTPIFSNSLVSLSYQKRITSPSSRAAPLHPINSLLLLCGAVICRASDFIINFKAQEIDTTWMASDAQLVGKLQNLECARRCLAADKCYAFHLTSDGDCYLVKENKNWIEQRPNQSVTFWIEEGTADTKCKALEFPESLGKSQYYLEKANLMNWSGAAAFCEAMGGRLAQISTEAELHNLWNLIRNSSVNSANVFVGAHKDPSDDFGLFWGWRWGGWEEPLDSSLWERGQPDNGNDIEFCVGFNQDNRCLRDVENESFYSVVCECSPL